MIHQFFVSPVLIVQKSIFYIYFFTAFFLFENNATMPNKSCDKTRQWLNSTWGIIADGPKNLNYTQDSHCEWLIKAPNKEYFITLVFHSMGTECSYDYVFVYDGDNFKSPLLGSFSGKNEPQHVTAKSGSMLILLYSDANYVLGGFEAEYSVTKCPRNCTGHGICISNKCFCDTNWGDIDCSVELCPDNCGSKFGRGVCEEFSCKCSSGYSGQACDLNKSDSVGNRWHLLSSTVNGFAKRAAHTAVYDKLTDSLYIFGGYDLNHILGDLSVYSFNTSKWKDEHGNLIVDLFKSAESLNDEIVEFDMKQVLSKEKRWSAKPKFLIENLIHSDNVTGTDGFSSHLLENVKELEDVEHQNISSRTERKLESFATLKADETKEKNIDKPLPRYGHAASRYPGGFVIYGGKMSDGKLSDELWFYNVITKTWSLRAKLSTVRPPKLTRHTLSLVGEDLLYLFGGSTVGGEFSSAMYSIQLMSDDSKEQWRIIRPTGGKEFDVRLVAHTAVYSPKIDSLIIYGGITAGLARLSKLSDRMFLFKISSRHWSEVHYPKEQSSDSYIPRERAFHTSVILGNYLVVFGGYSHRHNKEEICYDNQMYLYHLGCHTWISPEVLGSNHKTSTYWKRQGVFAHAADIRNGNTLLISGGYHGNVNGDLWAYVLPATLSSKEGEAFEPEQICGRHHSWHECTSNPECGWCSADEICYGRTIGNNCTTNLQTTRCPGLCPSLGNCYSCLIHGEMSPSSTTSPFSVAHKLRLGQCTWCVQNARCHHKDDNYGVCGLRENAPLQIPGWWGVQGTEITSVEECRIKDRRPGFTFIKYKHPANYSHPDLVSIINATTVDIDISLKDAKLDNPPTGGVMVARLLGFLRIPKEWAKATETLKMCNSFSNAVLRITQNPSTPLEVVGNITADSTTCSTAFWRPTSSVVLFPGRYLIDFESKKSFILGSSTFQPSNIFLMHSKTRETAKIFTFEYLEPYQNGSCHLYSNCLQCLTDSDCGWCDLSGKCMARDINKPQFCGNEDEWRFLTLEPSACVNCSNYISCENCVASDLCEWWVDEAKCSRRGRSSFAVLNISQCPAPCYLRKNCSFCLNDRGRCVWCESTQECFSFSVYTSEYQFGTCREWVDQNYSPSPKKIYTRNQRNYQCKSCSSHLNCSSCLNTLSCGWCYEISSPVVGVCVSGDFNQPDTGSCSSVILNNHNKSLSFNESGWSYAQCPDINECDLKLDNCHSDAICTNTPGSFTCVCKRGFYGDGRRSCTKTCYNNCIHGVCSMAPHYRCQCDLGWTGEDCGIDCGCNNHSTCNEGVGICDQCQDWTTGEFCQFCKVGSYGNATSKTKCQKCECNGHGDSSLGFCDSATGVCFCKDNTEGDKCEKCKKGYYGNPENGGVCYYECVARGIMSAFKSHGIGSYRSSMTPWEVRLEGATPKECLWVLNASQFTNITQSSVIQLTIYGDINVNCLDNSVFVYEGLPDLVSFGYQNHALGAFCQRDNKTSLTVETKSGVLTVLYKQGYSSEGFNASYSIFNCPDDCPPNRKCIQNECSCLDGWTGPNCSLSVCYNNCSFQFDQGVCDREYGRCICKKGYGGADCGIKLMDYHIIFTELFNSAKLSPAFDHLKKMIPRFGHTVVIDRRGSLWMFGGYSFSHGPLNDIRLFDTKNNTWMQVTVDSTRDASMPQGRYFHASEIVHSRREIFVFGGISNRDPLTPSLGNVTLKDFWKFNIKHQRWVEVETKKNPPPVAGHTLTFLNDLESEFLYLIGGFSPQYGFSAETWCFSLETNEWRSVKTTGNGPKGIFGHTSVYHEPTKSFYVYGGYRFTKTRPVYSSKLYSFHYPTVTWSSLPTFEEYNPQASNLPQPRFLHSAITTEDHMLIFGGKIIHKNRTLSSYSDLFIAYSYSCNQWFRLLQRGSVVIGTLPSLTYAQAMTYDFETGAVYVIGGFDNVIYGHVTRINLPRDLCKVWQGKDRCRSFLGCSYGTIRFPNKPLMSCCYSSSKTIIEGCDYLNGIAMEYFNGTLSINNGVVCDSIWFQSRNCEYFQSCSDCLAKWPAYLGEIPVCKWCANCPRNRCTYYDHPCRHYGSCDIVLDVFHCFKQECMASDCSNCKENEGCEWIDGFCLKKNSSELTAQLKPCVSRCSDLRNCSICLSNNCKWSTALKECISPNFQPLFCAGGICGLVLNKEHIDQCPKPCFSYNQCASCLKNANCGWCSLNDGNYTGQGVCIEGTIDKPLNEMDLRNCEALLSKSSDKISRNTSARWNYVTCPEENECTNGHHTCDPVSEVCQDLPQGFQCVCISGYKLHQSRCEPVCSQGCVRGKCVRPDQCACDFGYVGANCSIQCQCNGHSNCAGPDKLDVCLECHNNTKGAQCEKCQPLFVGDPTNNGKCVPCFEYCNRHTNICISDSSSKQLLANKSINELAYLLEAGPKVSALCLNCTNHTKGRKCDECMEGYFRGTDDLRHHCRPCECHGHGDKCDPITGEKCNCANNTESECQSSVSKNSNQQCWMLQCSKCKEGYSGTPTEGHQCYRLMSLDHKFCFTSKGIEECMMPKPLYPGQSVFFLVQPRYVNVDIRIFVDVMRGSLDFFLSLRDDSLVVLSNSSSGQHSLEWDPKYRKKSIIPADHLHNEDTSLRAMDLKLSTEKKLSSGGNGSIYDLKTEPFFGMELEAEGLTTYVTVNKKNTFLRVKNIEGRLIVTLPKDKFDLVNTRFFMGLMASTEGNAVAPTYGAVFFRQDQLHIDLFVFFSVFFACFFLFLAGCVIVWKAKQAVDMRMDRRRLVVEMLHMAKRPFAKVILQLENEETEEAPNTRSQYSPIWKRSKWYNFHPEIRPVAVEPTEDGVAAIATLLVKLPGGSDARVQLSLASSLVIMSRINSRVFLRRRNSHHTPT